MTFSRRPFSNMAGSRSSSTSDTPGVTRSHLLSSVLALLRFCSTILTQKQTPQPLSIEKYPWHLSYLPRLALHACTRISDFKSYNLTALLPTLLSTVRTGYVALAIVSTKSLLCFHDSILVDVPRVPD